jgi:hypothetical protein
MVAAPMVRSRARRRLRYSLDHLDLGVVPPSLDRMGPQSIRERIRSHILVFTRDKRPATPTGSVNDGVSDRAGNVRTRPVLADMHLVEILLPANKAFVSKREKLAQELSCRFGGLTAFTRSPAKGLFKQGGKQVEDDIVVFEVMVQALDQEWWQSLRDRLERDFEQDEIVIRASAIERL